MSAKLHHGAVAFVSIDNEDILLLRAGEILAAEGGWLKGLCLADRAISKWFGSSDE
jgi:hypothetical protein